MCGVGGCHRETALESEIGFEISPGDSHALTERILWLLHYPVAMQRMGQVS